MCKNANVLSALIQIDFSNANVCGMVVGHMQES